MNEHKQQPRDAFASPESRTERTIDVEDVNGSTAMKETQLQAPWLPGRTKPPTQEPMSSGTSRPSPGNSRHSILKRSAGRICAVAAAAAAVMALTVSAHVPKASAAVWYGVNMQRACQYTYNDSMAYANTLNLSSPYSWYCYHERLGYPYEWWYLGGVDVQKYCSITYPGSVATVAGSWYRYWPAYRWACVRNW
jgi:hypothetical protein